MIDLKAVGQGGPYQIHYPPHFDIQCFPNTRKLPCFTGPDGLHPHRAHRLLNRRPLGTNPYTREATWDADYLWRTSPAQPNQGLTRGLPCALFGPITGSPKKPSAHLDLPASTRAVPVQLRPRSSFAGEVGWHEYAFRNLCSNSACTGHQILTSEFRRELEDRWTHRYQNPWYPGKGEVADPSREGSYFTNFPRTGQLKHTDSKGNEVGGHSSGGARGQQQRSQRRTPAATPTQGSSQGEAQAREEESVEHSEAGGQGQAEGGRTKPSRSKR